MKNKTSTKTAASNQNLKTSIICFACMLVGPFVLFLGGVIQNIIGYFPKIASNIIMWTALILPAIGFIISIYVLFAWKKTSVWGRTLSLVTFIMCNPFFYFIYFIICVFASNSLAGIPMM